MNVSDIINIARTNAHVTSSQVSDADCLKYLNIVYRNIANAITSKVGEDFFFQVWTRDAVADQVNGEYPYPTASATSAGMLKLKKLAVKTTSDATAYTMANEISLASLSRDWDWHLANQPLSNPIYFIADESVFIAPNFTSERVQSGAKQIKLYGIKHLVDLTSSDLESDIQIPAEYHSLLPLGMEQWIYRSRGKFEASGISRQVYEETRYEMLDNLSNRDLSTYNISIPSTLHLE